MSHPVPRAACLLPFCCALLIGACATPSKQAQPPPATPPDAPSSPSGATPSRQEPETDGTRATSVSGTDHGSTPASRDTSEERGANDASQTQQPSASPGAAGTGRAMTPEEQDAAWDERFQGSLGEFDRRLAREQAEIEKQRSTAAAGGGAGAGGDAGGSTGAGMPAEQAPGDPADPAAEGAQTAALGGYGNPTSGPRFPAPADVPDGKDDDVVARQLREAAETEKDPELRARLWEEYRKYKSR